MALLWIEGFEGVGSTDNAAPAPSGILARKYAIAYDPSYMKIQPGRTGGHCFETLATWVDLVTPNLTTNATMVVGFGYYFQTQYSTIILSLYDGATQGMNLRRTASGELAIYRGGTLLATTTGLGLLTATWYWIELKVVCNATTGSYEVRVGEVNKLSASGVNTKAGSNDYHTKVWFRASDSGVTRFDDIYILDGSGSVNNDFLGNQKVVGLFPNGDVSGYTDFTLSTGTDHYAVVDENPINDDTDYAESATTGHKDLYDYPALTGTGSVISGVQINTMVRETDANSFSLKTLIKSGATEDEGSAEVIGSTSYKNLKRISETDPATAAAWTVSGINAAQFGIKVG